METRNEIINDYKNFLKILLQHVTFGEVNMKQRFVEYISIKINIPR
jgi:hypothetical protein